MPDVAAVVGVEDEVDRVVSGQGDVGQAADKPRRVFVQRAEHYVVHAACMQHTCRCYILILLTSRVLRNAADYDENDDDGVYEQLT